ncbi:MAG: hypothetical protein ACTSWD_00315 [Candidatus Heimdallarchaeota archaeon]
MDFPSIRECTTVDQKSCRKVLRSDFSAGYVQTRPLWTRTRKKFILKWSAISSADKALLESFFDTHLGASFTWNSSLTDSVIDYTVLFTDDELNFEMICKGWWTLTLELEEQ